MGFFVCISTLITDHLQLGLISIIYKVRHSLLAAYVPLARPVRFNWSGWDGPYRKGKRMQVIKRTGVSLILAVALLGGLVGPAAPAIAAPVAVPTVDVGWNWWLMGGYAKFDRVETTTIAQMSVMRTSKTSTAAR